MKDLGTSPAAASGERAAGDRRPVGWGDWSKLTTKQKLEAARMRPAWRLSDFRKFEFWVCPDGHVSRRRGGGSHQLSDRSCNALLKEISGEAVRSKGDNREWKPGVTYHFTRD